jgi:hypothetical protein
MHAFHTHQKTTLLQDIFVPGILNLGLCSYIPVAHYHERPGDPQENAHALQILSPLGRRIMLRLT